VNEDEHLTSNVLSCCEGSGKGLLQVDCLKDLEVLTDERNTFLY